MLLIHIDPESRTISLIKAPSVPDVLPGRTLERIPLGDNDTLWIDEEGLLSPFKPFTFFDTIYAGPAVIETKDPAAALFAAVLAVDFPNLNEAARQMQASMQASAAMAKAQGAIFCGPSTVTVQDGKLVAA